VLAIAALLTQLWINSIEFDSPVARISQNGRLLYEIPLSQDTDIELGGNQIQARDGKIGVIGADCPTQVCVNTGFVCGVIPIICIPNRVEIRIVNSGFDLDGITG
jgi:hypothetical protein